MKNQNFPLNISEEEKTPLVKWLLEIIDSLNKSNLDKENKIEHLTEEINKLKKLKGKPQIKPSNLNDNPKKNSEGNSKRAGSEKKSKKITFKPDEEIVLKPLNIPEGSVFKGAINFDIQELLIQNKNIRYKILKYKTPDGKYIQGELPENHKTHFGPILKSFIIYQHHQCRIPQNIIHTQLQEFGVDISEGQINSILTEKVDLFHKEKGEIFESGLETATYVFTDDTSARHKGKNNFCNVIGNDFFTIFNTTESKSKKNFIEILGKHNSIYIFNEETKEILQNYKIDEHELSQINFSDRNFYNTRDQAEEYLLKLKFKFKPTIQKILEMAHLSGAIANGLPKDLIILSDGAPQFDILTHALCWVHIERPLKKLIPTYEEHQEQVAEVRNDLWVYYRLLKDWAEGRNFETPEKLSNEFDKIFYKNYPNNKELNDILKNILSYKKELLIVLQNKKVPLHTNAAENDIREYVIRRKISSGTRNEKGKQARDSFVSIKKTCKKLGVSFWSYLKSRFFIDNSILNLGELVKIKALNSS